MPCVLPFELKTEGLGSSLGHAFVCHICLIGDTGFLLQLLCRRKGVLGGLDLSPAFMSMSQLRFVFHVLFM